MFFYDYLNQITKKNKSYLCIGLDSNLDKLPGVFKNHKDSLFEFNKAIIDATFDLVCAYKPQMAYYSAQSAESQLEQTIQYIKTHYPEVPVILDSKRGDIDATADQYAKESFDRYLADAVTVNPYMGGDTIYPFTKYKNKGVFVLCKTSNKSSLDFQNLKIGEQFLYEKVALKCLNDWNGNNNVGLVIGATFPEELKGIRSLNDKVPFLIPGVGVQGGDLHQVLKYGLTGSKGGLVINSSRAIIYAGQGQDFQQKARAVAEQMVHEMRNYFG